MKLLFLCVAIATWLGVSAGEEVPVVSTEEGIVSGIEEKAVNGDAFYSYYGIPYATPPTGELRFKDPTPLAKGWEGVRNGSTMPSPCIQVRLGAVLMGMNIPPEYLDGKEDCLFLNVFKPKAATSKGDLPVMVFIHGGGYFAGAADEYLPHVLLSKDVILVVIQYRLGFLGFLSTEDSVIPGNYGLKDQTLALQWVQRNIQNFGGDPKRVTIFGESAGGASVHFQVLSPKAEGLFSGAIMQSGNAFCPWAHAGELSKVAKEIGDLLGCSLEEGSQVYLKCMQSVNANKINAVMQDLPKFIAFPLVAVPRIDGDFLPDHPIRLMQDGRYNKVNIMAGVTANEGAIFTHPMYAREDLIPALVNNFDVNGPYSLQWYSSDSDHGKLTDLVYNNYLGGVHLDRDHADDLTQMMSDRHFNVGHDLFSKLHAGQEGVSTFRYELVHRGQMSVGDFMAVDVGNYWVSHGDELYYLFRGGPLLQPLQKPSEEPRDLDEEDDLHLRNIILTLWTNFAATGHPTSDESLGFLWSATTPDDLLHLALSPTPTMASDARKEVRKFFSSLPTKDNRLLNPHLVEEVNSSTSRANQDEL